MSTVSKYEPHYSVADYQQWPGDWELWQGTAIAMTPSPFGRHQLIGANLVRELGNALHEQGSAYRVLYEIDWIVSDDTVVRPEVVVCDRIPDRHLTSAPIFVAEILSPSTQEKDRTVKRELYQFERVTYYLLLDPAENAETCALLYKLSDDRVYEQITLDQELDMGGAKINLDFDKITA